MSSLSFIKKADPLLRRCLPASPIALLAGRPLQVSSRFVSSTAPLSMSLDDFRDLVPRQTRMNESVGRSWTAKELRRKSFEDLHKLWLVLYKENNMLLTEQNLSRRRGLVFPQPERMQKVKKSMGAIRQVLGERKRDKISRMALERMQEHEAEEDEETTPPKLEHEV